MHIGTFTASIEVTIGRETRVYHAYTEPKAACFAHEGSKKRTEMRRARKSWHP
jgi:hypothetical protein